MNWAQFKDPVSHMCLAGTLVSYWTLTHEVAGSSPFTVITNILVTEFSEKHLGKTPIVFFRNTPEPELALLPFLCCLKLRITER